MQLKHITKNENMKKNLILSAAALAAAVTLTPSRLAGDCAASPSASASARTASKDIVAIAAGAENPCGGCESGGFG